LKKEQIGSNFSEKDRGHREKLISDIDKEWAEAISNFGKVYEHKKKIYLSGPMTGIPCFNAPEFLKYATKYRTLGWEVISPPEMDGGDFSQDYSFYMRRDIRVLLEDGIDRVYLLPGWHKSKGANLEVKLAQTFNIPVYDAQTDQLFTETVAQEAQRIVGGPRGDDYGHPYHDFGRTAGMASSLFQHKLKEPLTQEDVSLFMMCVKLSRLANSPDHRDSLVDMNGYGLCYEMVREYRRKHGEVLHGMS